MLAHLGLFANKPGRAPMKAGDKVELRSPAEIVATLDAEGRLDGVPFMPEMLRFFGTEFTVEAQVERACDTVSYTGVRRLRNTVLLDDLRCDGSGHSGCQAECRLYWKEAWLRPRSTSRVGDQVTDPEALAELTRRATKGVYSATSTPAEPRFQCQATELLRASEPVGWWDFRSLLNEYTGGNVKLPRFLRVMTRILVEEVGRRLGLVTSYPFKPHETPEQPQPAAAEPQLQPGQLVQIKPASEIRRTLDAKGKTRGLWFDREMKIYCGQKARVKTKVERFIDEGSGRMVELASDCYILEDVVCESYRSEGRWFCPRAIYPWWRQVWLRPVGPAPASPPVDSTTPLSN